jgi:hypothetical protein
VQGLVGEGLALREGCPAWSFRSTTYNYRQGKYIMTSVRNHPPLDDISRAMLTHAFLKQFQFFSPRHALVSVVAGARCRICARVFAPPTSPFPARYCGGSFCSQFPDEPWSRALVTACVQLQDEFRDYYWTRTRAPNWKRREDLTADQTWWWDTMNVFQQVCEVSLAVLGPRWWDLLVTKRYRSGTFLLQA